MTQRLMSDFDWHTFFHGKNGVRRTLFKKGLTTKQVGGCERICRVAMEEFGFGIDETAYFLATSYHETAHRMHPVRETLAWSDGQAIRRLEHAWKAGQLKWVKTPYWRDGWFGRGEVQLTHEYNYKGPLRDAVIRRFNGKYDIGANPSILVKVPEVSTYVLVEGMTISDTGVSDFTSSALEEFVNANKRDYVGARRTVNPGDKPSYMKIAGEADAFRRALHGAR